MELSKTKLKEIKKLRLKKYRLLNNEFIIEGEHLINEALKAGYELNVYDTSALDKKDLKEISFLECPTNLIATAKIKNNKGLWGNRFLLLDEIQDPGNLGTIIRSALAFNIDTIVLSNDSCDLYNDKVIRSTQGAMFHLNIIRMDLKEAINKLKDENVIIYGTNVEDGIDAKNINNSSSYAIVMGNEGRGLDKTIEELCDKNIYIKTNKDLESLNVAMATTIILYELDK